MAYGATEQPSLAGDGFRRGVDRDLLAALVLPLERHHPIDQGKEGIVVSAADVLARVPLGAPLAGDDVARDYPLAPKLLESEVLGIAGAAVRGGADPFLVSHASASLRLCGLRFGVLDRGDPDLGELAPVSGLPADVLPALEPEDVDLLALPLPDDLAGNRGALHRGSARGDLVAIRGEQHLIEGDLRAGLGIEPRKPEGNALLDFELLALGSDDGVHVAEVRSGNSR